MLLKPWRNLTTDLKSAEESWVDAFSCFLSSASKKSKDIMSGIQYFYESRAAADDEQERIAEENDIPHHLRQRRDDEEDNGISVSVEDLDDSEVFNEEGLANLMALQTPLREELHGRHAVELAKSAKIFMDESSVWETDEKSKSINNVTGDDLTKLMGWRDELKESVNKQNVQLHTGMTQNHEGVDRGSVNRLDVDVFDEHGAGMVSPITTEEAEASITAVDPSELKEDQYQAFKIITWHLENARWEKASFPSNDYSWRRWHGKI